MKRTLAIVTLCVLLLATVGAGIVVAQHGANPGKRNGASRTACTSRGRGRGVGWSAGRGRGRGVGAGAMTASFTARFDRYYQTAATWSIDASSSTGPITQYWVDYYYTDIAGNPVHGHSGAGVPDLAIQLTNIKQGALATATLTVYDASGNHVTSPEQTLPWS